MESDPLPTADSTGLEGPTHLAKRVGEGSRTSVQAGLFEST